MENRITRFLFPVLIGITAFLLFNQFMAPKKKGQPQEGPRAQLPALDLKTAPTVLEPPKQVWERLPKAFPDTIPEDRVGRPGFLVQFDSLGGGIRSLKLTDFYARPKVPEEAKAKTKELYQAISPEEEGLYSFVAEDFLGKFLVKNPRRPQSKVGLAMQQLHWERVKVPSEGSDGKRTIRYRLALSNGIIFEKDFVLTEGSREFGLVLRIRNRDPKREEEWFRFKFRGASVMSSDIEKPSFIQPPKVFVAYEEGGRLQIAQAAADGKPNGGDFQDVWRTQTGKKFLYAGSANRFFANIMKPMDEESTRGIQAVEIVKLPLEKKGKIEPFSNCATFYTMEQKIPAVPSGQKEAVSELRFQVFVGPKDRDLFSEEQFREFLPVADLDFSSGCFCAPGAESVGKFLLVLLKLFHAVVGNWGVSIIILTILVRGAMMPLNLKQAKAMRSYQQKMTRLKPQMDAIKERHKKNPQKMNQELMKFQKENKVFPPLMGCLPMLLTMPVFLGLFTMLRASFELRHQPFVGWINDLSQPDRFLFLGNHNLPIVPHYLNLLPILMMVFWVWSAFSQKPATDPQQRQTQQMMRFMPLIFGLMLYNYASGLALYMCVSAIWSLLEQKIVRKRMGLEEQGFTGL
ncbi:MAG TPA: membrane protein insertase YidC [Planctomycetes bacterium]|nr:membrane protein insertase YidC [Planctomycetota bacterium]